MNIKFIISFLLFRTIFFYDRKVHDLKDGFEISISKTNTQYIDYDFNINTNKSKWALFAAKTTKECSLGFFLDIYEYKFNNYVRNSFTRIVFNGNKNNNICEYYYPYTILNNSTNYIQFESTIHDYTVITVRIDLVYAKYNLTNNKPFEIYNLSVNNSYYLFLEFFEAIDISFIINNMTKGALSNINIHEFREKNISSRKNIIKTPISFITNNNQSKASFSYSSESNLTKYIALQIKPSYNISHFIAKYESSVNSIELNDGIWKSIDNLRCKEIYLFFIEATELTKVNISIIINNTDNEYDEYELPIIPNKGTILQSYLTDTITNYIDINVYEYETKNNFYSSYLSKNKKRLIKEGENFFMTQSLIEVNSTNTTYFAFSFIPNKTISNMLILIDISGGIFNLFNNITKNITKIKSDNDYLFFIEVKRFSYIIFTLTINNFTNSTMTPFSYIYFEELYNRENYNRNYKKASISTIKNGNQLILTIIQNISDREEIKYINFKIKPTFNIDYMLANPEVHDCYIDLDNYEHSKGIFNLKKNLIYYIKMNAWSTYKTNLILKAYNINSSPFTSIKIHECYRPYFLSFCEKNITKKIKFINKNNLYEATIEKENTNLNKHLFLFIEIIPEIDINYMVMETTINDYFKINTSTLIVIIFEIITLILMILCIIIHFKKSKLSKSKNISSSSTLLPNN